MRVHFQEIRAARLTIYMSGERIYAERICIHVYVLIAHCVRRDVCSRISRDAFGRALRGK